MTDIVERGRELLAAAKREAKIFDGRISVRNAGELASTTPAVSRKATATRSPTPGRRPPTRWRPLPDDHRWLAHRERRC